jgi:TolB-like protein/Flp pilus assembly protein TadD
MGDVYLGRDTRLNRKVALKCVRKPRAGGETLEASILHEARAAARISHANVATIHDVIEQDARAYIVMEFVEGESLAARLRRGRLPLEDAIDIGRQLASALMAAHAEGVVHRDLKPANVQITPAGSAKVLDFGLAHARRPMLSPSAVTVSAESQTDPQGPRAGTPAYMAPEQMLGATADERADIYSLGVVLFELATGKRPYEHVDSIELVQAPASLAPRADAVDPAVPSALADVIARALQCNPHERYQSASVLHDALRAVQDQIDAPSRWRRPTRLALAGMLTIGVTAAVFLWRGEADRRAPPRDGILTVAVLPFVNLSGNPSHEYFVDGMTDGLINALGRIGRLRVKARTSVMAFKGVKKPVSAIARELNVDVVIEGSAALLSNRAELARIAINVIDPATQTQLWSGGMDRDLRGILSLHGELARIIAGQLNVVLSDEEQRLLSSTRSVDPETYKLYLLGRHEWNGRTITQLHQALTYFGQAAERSPEYAPAYAGLADTYVLLTGDFAAIPRADGAAQAIASASRALAIDPELAEAYTSLAFANFFLLWNWDAAGEQFKRALELNPSYATAHHWYGNYLSDIGREDEALAEMRRALELDPMSAIISRDVAWPLFHSRRYDEAVEQLDATLAAFPGYLPAERLRARALAQRGNHSEAVRQFGLQKIRGDTPRARCELAWAYALAGRREEAVNELRSALAMKSGIYQFDVALAYTALDRPRDALSALERAFEERDPTMVNLKHDPRFDSLRSDPRFTRLLAQMRFP